MTHEQAKIHRHVATHELSEAESFGFFSEPADYWKRRKRVHRNQLQRERGTPLVPLALEHGFGWWQVYFEPSFGCPFEERIGAIGKCSVTSLAWCASSCTADTVALW